jgi:hypothetical protein
MYEHVNIYMRVCLGPFAVCILAGAHLEFVAHHVLNRLNKTRERHFHFQAVYRIFTHCTAALLHDVRSLEVKIFRNVSVVKNRVHMVCDEVTLFLRKTPIEDDS